MKFLDEINQIGKGEFFTYGLLGTLIIAGIYIIAAVIIKKIAVKAVEKKIKVNTKVVVRTIKILVYTIAGYGCLSLLAPFDGVLSKLWGSAGIIALVLGLVAQEALGNFVNGILITAFKPFKIGDLVRVNNGEYEGYVVDISLRDTVIKTYENTRIIIPNSLMNKATLENISLNDDTKGNFLEFDISYSSDIDKAKEIIKEEVMAHPQFMDIRKIKNSPNENPVPVHILGFENGGMRLRATVYSKSSSEGFEILSNLRENIKKRFDEEGIELAVYVIKSIKK